MNFLKILKLYHFLTAICDASFNSIEIKLHPSKLWKDCELEKLKKKQRVNLAILAQNNSPISILFFSFFTQQLCLFGP